MNFDYIRRPIGVDHVARVLAEYQMNLVIAPVSDPNILPPIVSEGRVDGVILQGMEPQGEAASLLRRLPVVWMMTRRSTDFWADHVEPDNWQNGALAADYLLNRGHRNCAIVNLQPNYPALRVRCHAFANTVEDAGGTVVRAYEYAAEQNPGHHLFSPGRLVEIIGAQLMAVAEVAPRPTALYIPNNPPMLAIVTALGNSGIKLGNDFEIVLGDREERLGLGPDSHVVQMDVQQPLIARRTVEQLLWRIKNPFERGPIGISVTPRLVTSDDDDVNDAQ